MRLSPFPAKVVTVSSKGQFTIPKRLRDGLGMAPGSRVEVLPLPDGFALRALRSSMVNQTAGNLRRFAHTHVQPRNEGGEPM